jgi:hypothetical protein
MHLTLGHRDVDLGLGPMAFGPDGQQGVRHLAAQAVQGPGDACQPQDEGCSDDDRRANVNSRDAVESGDRVKTPERQ